MNNELITIEPSQFGIEDQKAAQIKAVFLPMLNKMEALEIELHKIKSLGVVTPEICKCARELRLKYREVRLGTEKIHKEAKAFYLNGGRFVDSWKNAQKAASEGREQELERIEKHFEILEAERKAKLEQDRWFKIYSFVDASVPKNVYNLAEMTDEVFNTFLEGAKETCRLKKEAIEKAEEDRKRAAQEEAHRQMQIKIEQDKLRKEQELLKQEQLKLQKEKEEMLRKQKEQERRIEEQEKRNNQTVTGEHKYEAKLSKDGMFELHETEQIQDNPNHSNPTPPSFCHVSLDNNETITGEKIQLKTLCISDIEMTISMSDKNITDEGVLNLLLKGIECLFKEISPEINLKNERISIEVKNMQKQIIEFLSSLIEEAKEEF